MVVSVLFVCCLIVVPLPPGENPFAINNNNNSHEVHYYTNMFFFPVCVYVAFRTPNPDEQTLDELKKELRENGLDFNHLVKWENEHC
jgi:hypothetical protein